MFNFILLGVLVVLGAVGALARARDRRSREWRSRFEWTDFAARHGFRCIEKRGEHANSYGAEGELGGVPFKLFGVPLHYGSDGYLVSSPLDAGQGPWFEVCRRGSIMERCGIARGLVVAIDPEFDALFYTSTTTHFDPRLLSRALRAALARLPEGWLSVRTDSVRIAWSHMGWPEAAHLEACGEILAALRR